MDNPTIEIDLGQVLEKINSKLDKLADNVNDLKVGQVELKVKVENIESTTKETKENQKILIKDVSSLKGAKSLIVPIIVAVTTSILTLIFKIVPST